MRRATALLIAIGTGMGTTSCSTLKSVFAAGEREQRQAPIHNPFPDYYYGQAERENIVLRTRKGDRSVEVELPQSQGSMTDFVVPVSPAFDGTDSLSRSPASSGYAGGYTGSPYLERPPGIADREITSRFSSGAFGKEAERREIENALGVVPAEDPIPEKDTSYLAMLDQIKQLYRAGRFEAGLLEIDQLLRQYPTDARLYEMRGTLFDRIGQPDLALKSWNQSLRLNPNNASLRRFVERKQKRRGLASP